MRSTFEQVLEHVPNPAEVLRALRECCTPETVVRIAVPNILRAWEGRGFWKVWPFDGQRPHTLAPFEHLHGFSRNRWTPLSSRHDSNGLTEDVWCATIRY